MTDAEGLQPTPAPSVFSVPEALHFIRSQSQAVLALFYLLSRCEGFGATYEGIGAGLGLAERQVHKTVAAARDVGLVHVVSSGVNPRHPGRGKKSVVQLTPKAHALLAALFN